jgi:hypothetical protein
MYEGPTSAFGPARSNFARSKVTLDPLRTRRELATPVLSGHKDTDGLATLKWLD